MSAIDQLISISITQETSSVPQASFSIPAIFGSSNRFSTTMPTATTTTSSNLLTAISNLTGVVIGAYVSGTGIPAGSYITGVTGNTATMNNNATASGSVTITLQDAIRAYTSLAGMTADGFMTSDPEYVKASELLEQPVSPSVFFIGSYSASVAQVDTLTVSTVNTSHLYTLKINGSLISYQASGGNVQQDILAGLLADIATVFPTNPPVTGSVSGSGMSAILTLTSVAPGVVVLYTAVDSDLAHITTTPSHTITSDIAQAQLQNDTWYGLNICSNADQDITQTAAYIETQLKVFFAASNDTTIPTSSVTDIASVMKGKSYVRTALVYSPGSYNLGIESAWVGGQLPAVPGSNNWAYKTLRGISPDILTASQQLVLIGDPVAQVAGKNVNIFQTVGGVNITQMGTMIGGQFIDITIGIDWVKAEIKTNIFTNLTQLPKIPYTDAGTAVLISGVQAALDQGVVNGLIDGSTIVITAPSVLSVPASQRANRVAPTISFSFRLAGAFNAVVVQGTVTV